MSENSDEIPEIIRTLSPSEVELHKIEELTKEFENVEMLQNL